MTSALIGYPMSRAEAVRVCGASRFHNWTGTGRRPSQLGLRYTDKDQYVLGVECELGCVSNLPTLDDTMLLLMEHKKYVQVQVKTHGLDVSSLKIYPMECEEEAESYPEIRVIVWTG